MFITTFVISPFFYNSTPLEYFTKTEPYIYFFRNSLMLTMHKIPGVFSGNSYSNSINGSLWTLPVEFLFYIAIFITYKIKLLDKRNIKISWIILFVLTFFQKIIYNYIPIMEVVLPLGLLFFEGGLMYIEGNKIKYSNKILVLFIMGYILSVIFKLYLYGKIIFLPYIILTIGFNFKNPNHFPKILFDISYEIYLYGFFIQQCVCYFYGGTMNPFVNMVISIPVTIILSIISYRLLKLIENNDHKKFIFKPKSLKF